jgi:hypothetical protein
MGNFLNNIFLCAYIRTIKSRCVVNQFFQLAFSEGQNKETPIVFHIPQNHSHKKFNELQPFK